MNTREGKGGLKHQIKAKIGELEELLMNSELSNNNLYSSHVSDEITGHYQRKPNFKNDNIETTILYVVRLQLAILNLTLIFDFVELTPPDSIERVIKSETFYTASFEELLCNLEGMTTK